MERKELTRILDQMLVPLGYKKKGNYWVENGEEITKMVTLQKSKFSNSFYINYGYIINSIPLNGLVMHIFNGVNSMNKPEQDLITSLLDLENSMADEERTKALKLILQGKLIEIIQPIKTEKDILAELKERPHLNDIPIVVKKHYSI